MNMEPNELPEAGMNIGEGSYTFALADEESAVFLDEKREAIKRQAEDPSGPDVLIVYHPPIDGRQGVFSIKIRTTFFPMGRDENLVGCLIGGEPFVFDPGGQHAVWGPDLQRRNEAAGFEAPPSLRRFLTKKRQSAKATPRVGEATTKYLRVMEKHAAALRKYFKALTQFKPGAPEAHEWTLRLARTYFGSWRGDNMVLRIHLTDEDGTPRSLNLAEVVDLLTLAGSYNSSSGALLGQLNSLQQEYKQNHTGEDKKAVVKALDLLKSQALDSVWPVNRACQDVRQALLSRPSELADFDVIGLLLSYSAKIVELEDEKKEQARRAQREPRPYTVADVARVACRHEQTVHHHIRQLRNGKEIDPRRGARGGFRFTQAEYDIILQRMEVEPSLGKRAATFIRGS